MGGQDSSGQVAKDYSDLAFDQSEVFPGESSHGLMYFPAEAKRPTRLTFKIKIGQGKTKTVGLPL
jgi:hypothetical protein